MRSFIRKRGGGGGMDGAEISTRGEGLLDNAGIPVAHPLKRSRAK